jgi:hypothetical protein
MSRRPTSDPSSPMTMSLPASLQARLREFADKNPQHGSISQIVKTLLLDFLDKHKFVAAAPVAVIPVAPVVHAAPAPAAINNGLPPGLSAEDWAALLTEQPVAAPRTSAADFARSLVNPALTDRERAREELRKRDPEGWKRMQEEHFAQLQAVLDEPT